MAKHSGTLQPRTHRALCLQMRISDRRDLRIASIFFAAAIILLAVLAWTDSVQAKEVRQQNDEECLSCHSNPDLDLTLPSGEFVSLFVSPQTLDHSVHGTLGITCQTCHTDIADFPHPKISFANRRELSRTYYQACQKCHSDNYDKAQDSMHAQVAAAGNTNAPVCTDCHGAHDIQTPDQPRSRVSETCGKCHTQVFDQYKSSIHGSVLINEDNPDVPVCTDCHGVHNIHDPRTDQFRVDTPELCAGCHADPKLMGKYGLSADVYDTYKVSWHGVDVSVYKAQWPTIWHNSAVCTDCHGVHDIRKTGDPTSHVNPANLLATCQKCHPNAGPNWVGAWTGHQRVSLERTPFVFYTNVFYRFFSYFVLWVSAIYVFLQIIRATLERARRSL